MLPGVSWLSLPCIISRKPSQKLCNQSLDHINPNLPTVGYLGSQELVWSPRSHGWQRDSKPPVYLWRVSLMVTGRQSNYIEIISFKCTDVIVHWVTSKKIQKDPDGSSEIHVCNISSIAANLIIKFKGQFPCNFFVFFIDMMDYEYIFLWKHEYL